MQSAWPNRMAVNQIHYWPNEAKITVDFDLRMYVLQYLHLTALWPKEKPKKGLFSVYPKRHY